MTALFYSFVWAPIVFVTSRFGRGGHVMGHSRGKAKHSGGDQKVLGEAEGLRWIPPTKDIDPACGKTVGTNLAMPSVHDGGVYYFCPRACRETFEAAPEQYVRPGAETPPPQLENRHV